MPLQMAPLVGPSSAAAASISTVGTHGIDTEPGQFRERLQTQVDRSDIDAGGNCFFPMVLIGEESGSGHTSQCMQKVDDVAKGSNAVDPPEARSEARANADGNGSDDGRINGGKRTVGSGNRLNLGEGFEIAVRFPDSDGNGGAAVGGGSVNMAPDNGNGVTAPGNANGGPVYPTPPGEAEYTSLWSWGVERLTSVKRRARMGSTAPRAADPSPVNRQVGREVTASWKARGKSVNRRGVSKGKKVAAVPAARGPKVNKAGDGNVVNTGRRNAAIRGKRPLEVDRSKKDGGDERIGRRNRAHLVSAQEYSPSGEKRIPECGSSGEKSVPECSWSGKKLALECGFLNRLAMEWDMVPSPVKPAFDSMVGKLLRLLELHKS